jgi:glycosyltransferase involved in cell wall biosynthesis
MGLAAVVPLKIAYVVCIKGWPVKIAQIAPLDESVPPRLYGGTERIVAYLTEELINMGHDVTLFASGDSRTSARLVPCCESALRLRRDVTMPLAHYIVMLEEVRQRASQFDILHFHTDLLHCPFLRHLGSHAVTTLHGRLDSPELTPFYRAFRDIPLVSISDEQRAALPPVNWAAKIHHGLPSDLLPFQPAAGEYLAFLGRISPEKRPDHAIEIAVRSGLPLKIAAKIDKKDHDYWCEVVKPLVDAHAHQVTFVGEIGEAQKAQFLGNALALLFPIDWPEPFGLVMIEAMACGTPVIAFRRGAVPEIVDEGASGLIVDNVDEAVAAVRGVDRLDRAAVRACFDRRFTAERMARDYVALYEQIAAGPRVGIEHRPEGMRRRADDAAEELQMF